eukprot:5967500-Prymnesium_polylepis.1
MAVAAPACVTFSDDRGEPLVRRLYFSHRLLDVAKRHGTGFHTYLSPAAYEQIGLEMVWAPFPEVGGGTAVGWPAAACACAHVRVAYTCACTCTWRCHMQHAH